MKDIIKLLASKTGGALISLLTSIVSLLSKVTDVISAKQDAKKEKTFKEEMKDKESEIEKVCKKGTISDLLNLSLVISLFVFSGCTTSTDVTISLTKSWEGHYFSEQEAQKAVQTLELERKESVWILSDSTLNKVLEQILKEGQYNR